LQCADVFPGFLEDQDTSGMANAQAQRSIR
jgi:hypothetical protein